MSSHSVNRGVARWILAAAALAAGLLAVATPAAAAPRRTANESPADAYALSMGENSMSTNLSLDEYVRLREKRSGDFLWFRRAGRAYLIEDPATLAQARELFAPLRALEPEQEDLRRRQDELDEAERELDRQQEDLEQRMDRIAEMDGETDGDAEEAEVVVGEEVGPPTDEERAELDHELEMLRSQDDALRPRMREIESRNRELESIDRSLDAREEKLEREAEGKLWILIDQAVKSGSARALPRS